MIQSDLYESGRECLSLGAMYPNRMAALSTPCSWAVLDKHFYSRTNDTLFLIIPLLGYEGK